ncbi:MAG: DNA polymerase I [Candidatus Westeberhardia cardiocondylae]|nr:DNA polymerase I [Candidatus Westeberhardia cardiocondylae]
MKLNKKNINSIESTMYPLILVDGNIYLYRAYYAYCSFHRFIKEKSFNIIYCVLNMLTNLLIKYNPSYFAIVFDYGGKNFRNKLFKFYKSHRKVMPIILSSQITPLRSIMNAMGLMTLTIPGVEADDVIGTLVSLFRCRNLNILISTCDKDISQLVSDNVFIFNLISKVVFGPKDIFSKFGVLPHLIVDYLALVGDTSDNIPGVPGIGKKNAVILLKNFGNLEYIYKKIEEVHVLRFIGSNIVDKLRKNYKVAWMSYYLAKIKTDVKLNISHDDLIIKKPDFKKLDILFKKYKFNRWINILNKKVWPWHFM